MDRRNFMKKTAMGTAGMLGASALGPLGSLVGQATGSGKRPNIIVFLADDMGFSDIGCYGSEIPTPNIDRLASNGIQFTQFYNIARCSPARASLLTGLNPHQVGLGHLATTRVDLPAYQGYLNEECVTSAEVLKDVGYRTIMTGKWHVGVKEKAWPSNRGFDHFYGEHSYVDSYFEPTHRLFLDGEVVEPEGKDWYSTDAYTDYALKFLDEKQPGEQPFYLYLAYNAPHFPLQAFQEDIDKYRGKYMKGWDQVRLDRYQRQIELGITDPEWDLPPRDDGAAGWHDPIPRWEDVDDKELWDLKMASYAAQIDRMDQNIGRVLDRLEERGELENTVIFFLSDNGGCAEDWINRRNPEGVKPGDRNSMIAYGLPWAQVSNTPFRLYKRWVHEGGIATPFIAHWPEGISNPGTMSKEVGHVMDVMSTCIDLANADYPSSYNGNTITPMEGKSLVPVLKEGQRKGHDSLGWEHEGNRAFRKGNLKISWRDRYHKADWELYDLRADRTEMHDLSRKYPEKRKELISDYEAWADRVGVIEWDRLMEIRRKQRKG